MTLFDLYVNDTCVSSGQPRGDLLDWVETYYVERAGYEQVAVNHWAKAQDGAVVSRVRLIPVKSDDG